MCPEGPGFYVLFLPPPEDLSSPSYKQALGYEATRDAWRRISSFYSSQTGLLPNTKSLSPHALFLRGRNPTGL